MFFFMLTDEKSSLKVCKHCGDAIISVGYRVNSIQATRFRIWATGILKEYMIKGFAMDDDRLKQGKTAFGKDYFRELLERVRSIRTSERRIWDDLFIVRGLSEEDIENLIRLTDYTRCV